MTPRTAIWPGLIILAAAGLIGCAARQPRPVVLPPGGTLDGRSVARTAESMLGAPYRAGGALPDGFDCSGLVNYVFARHGVGVPRDVKGLAAVGRTVSRADVREGDLLFFTTTGPGPTHVAISVDHDRFIHAPKSGATVRIESLRSTYWASRFLFGRRLTH
jgi:cell wall-associated NlpC family hydrolase